MKNFFWYYLLVYAFGIVIPTLLGIYYFVAGLCTLIAPTSNQETNIIGFFLCCVLCVVSDNTIKKLKAEEEK